MSSRNAIAVGASVVLGLLVVDSVVALPTTVFVFNRQVDKNRNRFDSNALGFILLQLGLLDANGKPNIPEANKIKDPTGKVIGYKSSDGTKEAYDVNSGMTTDEAWKKVANGGMLHIIKHGANWNGPNGVVEEGGGMKLDRDKVYDGFTDATNPGAGTGAGYGHDGVASGPYPLTPRPGANITLNLNGCWTSKDPDGAGPIIPVTATGGGVPGVGTTMGEPNKVNTNARLVLEGGTPAEQAKAWDNLIKAAREAGYPPPPKDGSPRPPTTREDVGNYLADLPFDTRYDKLQEIADNGNPPKVRVKIIYTKTPAAAPAAPGNGQEPRQIPPSGGTFGYDYMNGDPSVLVAASMHVPPGSLAWPGIFQISMHSELPVEPPPTLALASGAFLFEVENGDPIVSPVEMSFAVFAPPGVTQILWFDDHLNAWRAPIGAVSMNGQVVTIFSAEMGLYAAFAPASSLLTPLPSLSSWAVGVLALLLALSGATLAARAARRRRA